MINAILGLNTSTMLAYKSAFNLPFLGVLNKKAMLQYAQNSFIYKISIAQQDSYKKIINRNIENSFNTFA